MGKPLNILLTGDRGVCEALAAMWSAGGTSAVAGKDAGEVRCRYSRPGHLPLLFGAAGKDLAVGVLMAGSPKLLERLSKPGWLARSDRRPRPVVLLWIGTDVYDFLTRPQLRAHVDSLNRSVALHGAVAPHLVDELATMGIEAELMPLVPPDLSPVNRPQPAAHRVIFYSTEGREEFYGAKVLERLAAQFPHIPFVAVGGGRPAACTGQSKLPNVQFTGRVTVEDLSRLYAGSTLLLRPATHDGLPKMALEALRYGLHVVTPVDIPGCAKSANAESSYEAARRILAGPATLNPDAGLGLTRYDPKVWTARAINRLHQLVHQNR